MSKLITSSVSALVAALSVSANAAMAAQPDGVYTTAGLRGPSQSAPASQAANRPTVYRWVRPNGAHDTFLNRVAVPPSSPALKEIPLAEEKTQAPSPTSAVGKGL